MSSKAAMAWFRGVEKDLSPEEERGILYGMTEPGAPAVAAAAMAMLERCGLNRGELISVRTVIVAAMQRQGEGPE